MLNNFAKTHENLPRQGIMSNFALNLDYQNNRQYKI